MRHIRSDMAADPLSVVCVRCHMNVWWPPLVVFILHFFLRVSVSFVSGYPSGLRLVPLLVGNLMRFGSARSPLLHTHKSNPACPSCFDFQPVGSQEQPPPPHSPACPKQSVPEKGERGTPIPSSFVSFVFCFFNQ